MTNKALLGPWIRRFLLEYLKGERNLAVNTQRSYRDALILLLNFLGKEVGRPIDQLNIEDISVNNVHLFLKYLKETRNCSIKSCNHRLAVVQFNRTLHMHIQP